MNVATISFSYLRARPWNTALILMLLALGTATITLLLLASAQLDETMRRDARGIDLVVGAKGSPMQLILSAIYHLDLPTGNIALAEAKTLAAKKPLVKHTIPMSLGDSYKGFRIVGTEHSYVAHYGGKPAHGRLWEKSMEAVLGADVAARTGLGVGGSFSGSHGFEVGGSHHGEHPYAIVGVLARTGTVLDRVILTSLESVWDVHAKADTPKGEQVTPLVEEEKEITALLIQYGSPLAVMQLPRFVNVQTEMQAASPAVESARLFSILGVGFDVVRAFAGILIVSAAISVFVALYNALRERRFDLAIMRTLGASRGKLMRLMILEGVLLSVIGAAIGIVLGHVMTEAVGLLLHARQQVEITGWYWLNSELWLLGLGALVGLVAALLPAIFAYRTDIGATLAES
jgi:putative ABC transport system permease protein